MGGIETHVHELAHRLAAQGLPTTILTTDPSKKLASREQSGDVRIIRVPAYPAQRDYYFAPRIYDVIMNGDWNIVHCQGFHTFVPPIAMLAAKRKHIPYLLSFHSGGHSSSLRNSIRWFQAKMNRPLLADAGKLVAVSQFEARLFQKRLGLPAEKFVVIPNGSNLPKVSAVPPSSENPLILSVGRLERYKGHHRILEALPIILKRCPDARLRILGTGPYEASLRQMAHELGVGMYTEIGSIPPGNREGMAMMLNSASLVTLLSEYEAHPLAVMEALSMKRPVLVADTSGLSELAERGYVRAIPLSSTPEEIAEAVLVQLRSPLIASGFELPTWDACATSILSLYEELVKADQCVS
jgi:glycosyltransferase involved in cell wall biosynthesis